MAIRLNDPLRSKIVDSGIVGFLGAAVLNVYAGTQPGTGGGSTSGSVLLVQIGSIAWNAASNGTATITGNKAGTSGTSGTPGWARLSDSSGTGYIADGNCGTASTCDFVIDTAVIAGTTVITLTAATIVQPAQ